MQRKTIEPAGMFPRRKFPRGLPGDLPGLLSLWRRRQPERWAGRPRLYAEVGRRFLERGEPLLAYDLFQEGLAASPGDTGLRRLLALSLARSGAPGRACEILTELYRRGCRDEETMGILARTHKDLAALAAGPRERGAQRALACGFYLRSYRSQKGYYAGINAAALNLLLGRRDRARALAREVRELCLARWRAGGGAEAYWLAATLGESALILEDRRQAELWYGRAAREGRGRYADLSSTRRQARLILEELGGNMPGVESLFRIPRVVAFTGHRIDAPGRPRPRFPVSAEGAVRAVIARRLEALDAGFGYASAACGSDIIFLEEMLKRGGEIHIVLPCRPEEFKATSVETAGRAGWGTRFERLLKAAVRVEVANDRGMPPGNLKYVYANLLLDGLARLKAASLDSGMTPLALWDGEREEGAGGTGSLVKHWRKQGLAPEVIPPPSGAGPGRAGTGRAAAARPEAQRLKALLFADVAGYSRLNEEQIPLFVRHFMGVPGALLRGRPRRPEAWETWGDALYLVFADVEDAGLFALELSERIGRIRWAKLGLPEDLSLRISLHAGPVYRMLNPVTGRPCYTGSHVTGGARIEPIAPPGQIYASRAFAALSAARGVKSLVCSYVGEIPLAKKFGAWPLYAVSRRAA